MKKTITAVMFGAGNRGLESYGPYALEHPDELKFVAVAEPDSERRERFAAAHEIPAERQFQSWEEVVAGEQLGQVVFNCTQDRMHYPSGAAAIEAGYDMLLEKPICTRLEEAVGLVKLAEQAGSYVQVCHVLRHTDYWQQIQEILGSGSLGQIITISLRENVSAWHMAHSFVRGNWRKEGESAPMILAKCCHDLDLLYWMVGVPVRKLSSVGSLIHFKPENAPPGAPLRCTDGCAVENSCPFYALALYIDLQPTRVALSSAQNPIYRLAGRLALTSPELLRGLAAILPELRRFTEHNGWPRSVISDDPSNETALLEALRMGPYGRCVYHCDNDVVDHQIVTAEFANGISASLTMHGHSFEECRTLRIDGSQATLLGKFGLNRTFIEIHDHRSMRVERIDFPNQVEQRGHGGGDYGVVRSFVRAMQQEGKLLTGFRDSLESHLMAFAAEEARLEDSVVAMDDFRRRRNGH